MVGIVGGKPFQDRMVQVDGDPARLQSEYTDVRGPARPEVVAERVARSLDDYARSDARDVGARIGGFLSRTLGGGPSLDEIAKARTVEAESAHLNRKDQDFAAMIASAVLTRPDHDVRRMAPGVGPDPLPKQRDIRWAAIAGAAIDAVHEHVDRGDDHGLGAEMGRRVRLSAVEFYGSGSHRALRMDPVPELLDRETAAQAMTVRNYMSAGPEVMDALTRQAMAASREVDTLKAHMGDQALNAPQDPIRRQEWTRQRLLERHALARSGGMDDASIMREARNLASLGGLGGDHSRDGTFVRPDAARSSARISMQEALHDRARGVAPLQVGARAAAHAQAAGRDR